MFFNKSFVFAILFATSALSAPVFSRADDAATSSSKALAGTADIAPALNSTVSQPAAGNSTATGQGAKGVKKGKHGKGKGKGKKGNGQQVTVTKTITSVKELTVTVTDKGAAATAAGAAGVDTAAAAQITAAGAAEDSASNAAQSSPVQNFSIPGSNVSVLGKGAQSTGFSVPGSAVSATITAAPVRTTTILDESGRLVTTTLPALSSAISQEGDIDADEEAKDKVDIISSNEASSGNEAGSDDADADRGSSSSTLSGGTFATDDGVINDENAAFGDNEVGTDDAEDVNDALD